MTPLLLTVSIPFQIERHNLFHLHVNVKFKIYLNHSELSQLLHGSLRIPLKYFRLTFTCMCLLPVTRHPIRNRMSESTLSLLNPRNYWTYFYQCVPYFNRSLILGPNLQTPLHRHTRTTPRLCDVSFLTPPSTNVRRRFQHQSRRRRIKDLVTRASP